MDRQRRGRGNHRGRRGPQRNRYYGPRQFAQLSDWVTQYEATDLLLHLENRRFVNLLEIRDKINAKLMVAILKALAKCIESNNRVLLNRFLGEVSAKTIFFRLHVHEYISELESEIMSVCDNSYEYTVMIEPKFHSICDLLLILKELLYLLPNQMGPVCAKLSILTESIRQIHHKKKLDDKVLGLLIEVESEIEKSKERKAPGNEDVISEPPNDFRLIPVIPTVDDIRNKYPFLRKNIVDHRYRDVYHYLDIQFRLMREDFIRPLRCGVNEYLKATAAGRRLHRLQDSFIYHNVRVKEIELPESGLMIHMKLDLLTMPKVNWNTSKRLMFGSLICFSCNKFEDFIIGTVGGRRDPKRLEKGHFEAIIDPSHELKFLTAINQRPDELFVIIEPLSYFEAYRHILRSLQDFTEDTFPLKKYIVNLETQLDYPKYLSEESKYNFSSFPSNASKSDGIEIAGKPKRKELSKDNIVESLIGVNVLKTDTWPPAKEFGMDESQYNALKDALTREVSVIQGPPGTGKTYIGLHVVQTLMMNREIWDEDNDNTILVTCYTNHALDQFMEGIEPFCKRLLRIGGRCRSDTLQKYCLRNLKRNFTDIPNYILDPIRVCKSGLYSLKSTINDVLQRISRIRKSLLPIEVLDVIRSEISENQANNLMSIIKQRRVTNESMQRYDFQNLIKLWLGFDFIDELKNEENVEEVDDDEDEVQRIEDERDADEDFESFVPLKHSLSNDSDEEEVEVSPRERNFKKYFLKQINSDDLMDIETARQVVDVTLLELKERWRLYRLWVKLYIASFTKNENTFEETNAAAELRERLQALRIEEVLRVVKDVKIIGATTTGAAKNRTLICRLKPKILIVEEAAEILESHIITSLTEDTKHLILIGDHIQLQPNSTVYDLAVNYNLNVSLFERLIRNRLSFSKLKIQHRMHPNISELLVPLFYSELENHEIVTKYESIRGVTRNIFFIGHNYLEAVVGETKSRYNIFEVDFVYKLCKHLLLQGYESSQITVLTMYSAQMFRIRSVMRNTKICSDVRVSAVDNFQGEENDIIICSFVRSNLEGDIGFLKTKNRINVAISRAKKGFYAIGNFDKMAEVSEDTWKPLVQKLKTRGFYGHALELYCQNHKETKLLASQPSDFDRFPEGCCLEPCNKRLNCGHVCPKSCHVYDVEHEQIKCRHKCLIVNCENGHRCPKLCHFLTECGPCSFMVEKKRYCGHTQKVQCSKNVDESTCNSLCDKALSCGHKCKARCGDDCSKSHCKEVVWVKPPCGHRDVAVRCWLKENREWLLKECMEPCNEVLKCEHLCSGSCGTCRQGRLHKKCNEKCERVLICGHVCKSPCAKNCPPCDRDCENSCSHGSKCKHKCGSLCPPCRMPCNWHCQHVFCANLCSEKCKQLFKPCKRNLPCNHTCIGINGMNCPKLCRICDRIKPEGSIFDNEDDDTCFVELSKCGHTFKAESLYKQWIEDVRGNTTDHWSPKCPQCKDEVEQIPFDMLETLKDFPDTEIFVHGCNEIRRCGHRCIGICGEVCPKLCRICDKEKVEEIFFGTEDDPNARFIQLPDCKHVFEFSGLMQWICQQSNESAAIQMKCCPKCKTIIRKSKVFNSDIQRCLADIERVKIRLVGSRENNSRKTLQLQTSILELTTKLSIRNDRFCSDIENVLMIQGSVLKSKKATNVELEKVSNILKIVESLIGMEVPIKNSDKEVVFYDRLNCVIKFLRHEFDNNEQQLFDITYELNLLKKYLSVLLLKRKSKEFRPEVAERIDKVNEMFHSIGRMSEEKCEKFEALVNEILKMESGITIEEKKMILNAMNFGQRGHWFKCPNGHPYCITECGGAMETSKCPECNEQIGGTSHQLLSTNRVASDLDGATMSAYDYSAQRLPDLAQLAMFAND